MVDFLLDEDESYAMRCGEVYWTTRGRMIFHCCLCELKMHGFDLYEHHLKDHVENFSEVEFFEDDWTAEEDELGYEQLEIGTDNKADELKHVHVVDYEELLDVKSEKLPETNDEVTEQMQINTQYALEIEKKIESVPEENFIKDEISESSEFLELTEIQDEENNTFGEISYAIMPAVDDATVVINGHENVMQEVETNSNTESTENKKTAKRKRGPRKKSFGDESDDLFVMEIEPVREVEKREFPRSQFIREEDRKFKCPICNLGFKERHNMKHHLLRHTDKKDHKCPKCGKAFYTQSEVTVHIRSHSKERAFLCSICGNSYVYSSHLSAHLKRHGTERKYKCEICGKAFFEKAKLTDHKIDHSTVKQFACGCCNATFNRLKALKNHEKLHENKKEFKCNLCPGAFNQRAGLFSHMKNVHNKA